MRLINAPNGFLESAAFLVCFVIQHLHHGDPQTCFEKPVPCISRDASGRHRSVSGLIVVQRRLRQSVLAGCLSRTVLHTLLSPTPCRVLSSLGTSPDRDSIYEQLDAASGVCPYWGTASSSARAGEPYTKSQLLAYWTICDELIDGAVDALDLAAPECGFFWYKVSKIEHQMINLRHLQHHMAQLGDRLRNVAGVGVDWVGSGRRPAQMTVR